MVRFRLPLLALAALAACVRGSAGDTSSGDASGTPLAAPVVKANTDAQTTVIDFAREIGTCTVGHRGFLLDLADSTMRARVSGTKLAVPDAEPREHEGASWLGVRARQLEASFVSPAEVKVDGGVIVEARVRGGIGKGAVVFLNGKPLGSFSLTKGETKIVSVRAPGMILRGANDLMLRFTGGTRASHDELAEVDWIRIGPNDGDAPYSAPTRTDAIATVSIAGNSRRGVSLRAPGFARCASFIPNGSVLEGAIGVSGGEAEAEVRLLVDRSEPRTIGSFHLGGPGDPPGFRPIALPLGDVGTLAAVELVAKTSSKGARVVFAEPRVMAPSTAPQKAASVAPKARGVVLVVFGELPRRQLSLYGGSLATPELAQLASGGTVFETHRASSSIASSALGSMLTGLWPRDHGAADAETILAPNVFTVAEAARQAGIVTAMFTANPTTTSAFGFARGWETFVTALPTSDSPAVAIFDEAARWLDAHKDDRFLLVVHARGGHPPWDVTSEELKELPPANYAGSLEPKHAGEALAKARRAGGGRLFSDPDRERAFALHAKAVAAHDAALGRLVAHVKSVGRDKDTVFITSGDVGVDAAARVPFLDDDGLDEGALALPLVLRGPDAAPRARIASATSSVDVARTILDALALAPPQQLRGDSLFSIAGGATGERPVLAATSTRFSMRWAGFALVGFRERELRLCNLSLDPDCVSDVRATHPLATEVLHGLVYDELVTKPHALVTARPATDAPTTSALHAWGR